jgi:hypothetical protein
MFAYRSILHEPPRPAFIRENLRAPWLAVGVVCFGAFMGQLDASNTVIMRGAADSSASLVGGLVSMARGIGTTLGISLMALAWHLGSQSSQAGNHEYSGTEQARPAFVVLAVVAAAAVAIARASRAAQEGGPGRCGPARET